MAEGRYYQSVGGIHGYQSNYSQAEQIIVLCGWGAISLQQASVAMIGGMATGHFAFDALSNITEHMQRPIIYMISVILVT